MHIEPGIVNGAKMILGMVTAAGAGLWTVKLAFEAAAARGLPALAARSAMATAATFVCFQVLPHQPVGVSEVHLTLGSTLFLLFGAAPAAVGLALGLLLQGVFFAPIDLPQYGMNVTTLLVPLFLVAALARRIVAPGTAYADLSYEQVMRLSLAYQGGVVAWVAFWAFWGQGVTAAMFAAVGSFGAAYLLVVAIEPLIGQGLLACAKALRGRGAEALFAERIYAGA
jgi:hypothetical protein